MIRFLIYVLLFSLTVVKVSAEGNEMNGEPEKKAVVEVKTAEISLEKTQQPEDSLKVYSMNNVLFIETNSEETIFIFTDKGELKKEITPTGTLIALPMSQGSYIVKVGNLSRRVAVR